MGIHNFAFKWELSVHYKDMHIINDNFDVAKGSSSTFKW